MTNPMFLLSAYRAGYLAAQVWRQGMPVRNPYWSAKKWAAWHAGFDRGLYAPPNSRLVMGSGPIGEGRQQSEADRDHDAGGE